MILTEILKKNARDFSDKTAWVMKIGYRTVTLTYQEVYNLSLKVACFLREKGVEKNDKVLLLAPNSPYWGAVYWGSLLRGTILVPLNVQSTPEMIGKIAKQTEAKIIFKYLHYKKDLPKNLQVYDIEFIRELLEELDCRNFSPFFAKEDDLVEIMYTSGTTGDPKGVMLTHQNIYSNLEALSSVIPISPANRFLSILPLSHIYEQVIGFLLPFFRGSEVAYSHSPTAILDLMKEHRITIMAAVPEFLRIVMNRMEAKAEKEGKKKLLEKMINLSLKIGNKAVSRLIFNQIHKKMGRKLDTVASGGAPLDPSLERKWNALGIDLLQGYGLTETSPIVSCNTYKEHRTGSVGKILPGVEVRIASDGEILVRGPNVFQGYFKNEEKTKAAFTHDRWFKTEDIGELDKDGFLFIKGRKKYMILGPGGQNVFPEDIEFELNKIAGVKDSAVVGIEKPAGVEIHAVLLLDSEKPLKNVGAVIEEVNEKLASYQKITNWSVWPEEDFPRSATRKVRKELVLQWLREKGRKETPLKAAERKTSLMRLLAEITETTLEKIQAETKIVAELNLDSLLRIELVSRIEEKFGIAIDEAKITPATTVSDLEALIKKSEATEKKLEFKHWPLSYTVSILRSALRVLMLFPFLRLFIKLKVEGKENLEGLTLPAIFMPNHPSYLDSAIVAMALPARIRRKIAFAAAADVVYKTYKRFSWLAELLFNAFPFPREERENIKFGLDYMGKLLDRGWSIIVYPEGKMSLSGEILPLKRGAGLIAVEMNSFVVPVKISGTQDILPPGKFVPTKRGLVKVKFGRPVKFKSSDSYISVTEEIQSLLKQL